MCASTPYLSYNSNEFRLFLARETRVYETIYIHKIALYV